jgi:hypothetical protein
VKLLIKQINNPNGVSQYPNTLQKFYKDEFVTVELLSMPTETPLCCANRRKDFRESSNQCPMSLSFSSVKIRFPFNGCRFKYRGFELPSIIWKLYLQMGMLCREIYGDIFSCTICMSFLYITIILKTLFLNRISHES